MSPSYHHLIISSVLVLAHVNSYSSSYQSNHSRHYYETAKRAVIEGILINTAYD